MVTASQQESSDGASGHGTPTLDPNGALTVPDPGSWLLRGTLLASALFPGPAHGRGDRETPGDVTNVEVLQTFDAVSGVRLLEVRGRADGKVAHVWLMISERNYARLVGCRTGPAGARGIALSYSDRSHMVNVVVCN